MANTVKKKKKYTNKNKSRKELICLENEVSISSWIELRVKHPIQYLLTAWP